MKKYINNLEDILAEQIIIRISSGVLILLIFLIILIMTGNLYACLTLLGISFCLLISGIYMLYNCIIKNILCISGECISVEYHGFLRKRKLIYLEVEGNIVKLSIQKRRLRIAVGDTVTVYIYAKAPIIPCSDGLLINQYYAIKVGGNN